MCRGSASQFFRATTNIVCGFLQQLQCCALYLFIIWNMEFWRSSFYIFKYIILCPLCATYRHCCEYIRFFAAIVLEIRLSLTNSYGKILSATHSVFYRKRLDSKIAPNIELQQCNQFPFLYGFHHTDKSSEHTKTNRCA